MKKIYFIIAVLCIASLFASCNQDQAPDVLGFGDEVEVEMNILTASMSQTRAYDSETEDNIQDLTVLVFDTKDATEEGNAKFLYSRHAWKNGDNYRAVLKTGTDLKIYLAANAQKLIEDEKLDDEQHTYTSVRNRLILTKPDELVNNYLPMWGIVDVNTISESSTFVDLGTVQLLRSVASVDLVVEDENKIFKLESAIIVRATSEGFLAHEEGNITTKEPITNKPILKIIDPDVPDGALYNSEWESTEVKTTSLGGGLEKQEIANKLYMFENDATATTCPNKCYTKLIIKGKYDGTSYYYPLSFRDDENDGKKVQAARNRKFIITVTAVNGPGFTDKEDAIESEDVNIDFKVIEWDKYEDETTLYVDGDKYVSFIDGKSILLADKKDSDALRWFTTNALKWSDNVPTNLKWSFGTIGNDTELATSNIIINDLFTVSIEKDKNDSSGESYFLKVLANKNYYETKGNDLISEKEAHTSYLSIRIGNIQFNVKIRQVENAWNKGNEQDEDL